MVTQCGSQLDRYNCTWTPTLDINNSLDVWDLWPRRCIIVDRTAETKMIWTENTNVLYRKWLTFLKKNEINIWGRHAVSGINPFVTYTPNHTRIYVYKIMTIRLIKNKSAVEKACVDNWNDETALYYSQHKLYFQMFKRKWASGLNRVRNAVPRV